MGADEQRLPDDVLQIVCVLAARQDRYAAYSLALVSHKTCQWTARERWRTVVIRSARQLVCFWKAIYAVPDAIYYAFLEQMNNTRDSAAGEQQQQRRQASLTIPKVKLLDKVENRCADGLSYPADGKPHRHVKNLFIDLSSDHVEGQLPGAKVLQHSCLVFMATDTFMHTSALADPRSILHRWSSYTDKSTLDCVSLGIDESDSVNWSALQGIAIRELTLVLRADHSADLHVDMTPSVRRLHVVGIDPESELTGVEPPWKLFKALKSPIAIDSLSPIPSLTHRRLTHLRYDTRSFSLRPVEIMALRLRPLLQECTIPPISTYSANDTSNVAASFQFSGPRHAAPARGAGSYLRSLQRSRLTPVAHLAEHDAAARYLDGIGVGCLDLLHFAWERKSPAVVASEVSRCVPWFKRKDGDATDAPPHSSVQSPAMQSDVGGVDQTGGWPREMRGAWAEQGERSTTTKSKFAVELRDAINTLYGWHAPDIEAAGRFCRALRNRQEDDPALDTRNTGFSPDNSGVLVDQIQSGMHAVDKDELRAYALLLQRKVPEWRASLDDNDDEDGEEESGLTHRAVRMGVRAPRSLIHLGGHAAFTESDRLRLFEERAGGGQGPWP